MNDWRAHLNLDNAHAESIEGRVLGYGLECVEGAVDCCSSWKEAFADMVIVQRSANAHVPNDLCVLGFVTAMVAEAFLPGVHGKSAFESHEGSGIQWDGVQNLDKLSLVRIAFAEEVHRLHLLST